MTLALTKDLAGIVSSSSKITEQVTEQSDVKTTKKIMGLRLRPVAESPKRSREETSLLESIFPMRVS